ncbi:MAG: hypothetical protein JSS27_18880 [Planctomycetes bacterium]|nr:hypothetical protein [Planctomycetota bacterium]
MCEESIEGKPVTLDVVDLGVEDVFSLLARRSGVVVHRVGGTWYLGQFKPEDRSVLVRRVRRLDAAGIRSAVSVLVSASGKCEVFGDGLTIVGERADVLERVSAMLDRLEQVEAATWVCQLHVLSASDAVVDDLGMAFTPSLDVSVAFNSASNNLALPGATTSLRGGFDALLKASRDRLGVSMLAEPLLLLVDGSEAEFIRGQRVPVPTQTYIAQGASNNLVNSVNYQQLGLTLRLKVREVGPETGKISVHFENSSLQEYINNIPVIQRESYDGEAVIRSGGIYLVGSLRRHDERHDKQGWWRLGQSVNDSDAILQVWCRAARVGGPVLLPSLESHDETVGIGGGSPD